MHTLSKDKLVATCSEGEMRLLDAILGALLESHATRQDTCYTGSALDNRPSMALTTLGHMLQKLGWPRSKRFNGAGALVLAFEGVGHNSRIMARGGALWVLPAHTSAHTALGLQTTLQAARAAVGAALNQHKA